MRNHAWFRFVYGRDGVCIAACFAGWREREALAAEYHLARFRNSVETTSHEGRRHLFAYRDGTSGLLVRFSRDEEPEEVEIEAPFEPAPFVEIDPEMERS